jgi:hypothetical protein
VFFSEITPFHINFLLVQIVSTESQELKSYILHLSLCCVPRRPLRFEIPNPLEKHNPFDSFLSGIFFV